MLKIQYNASIEASAKEMLKLNYMSVLPLIRFLNGTSWNSLKLVAGIMFALFAQNANSVDLRLIYIMPFPILLPKVTISD